MAAKQARSSHVLYLEFDGQSLVTAFRKFDPGVSEDVVDATSGADGLSSEHTIRATVAPTGEFLVLDDATGQAIRAKLKVGTTGNLIWGEEGNASGKPRGGITARVKKANIAFSFDGEQVIQVEWSNTSADWLYDPNSSTF